MLLYKPCWGIVIAWEIGFEKNDKQAFLWFQRSSDQGSSFGQMYLANCYYYGKGVLKDFKQALKGMICAAEQDNILAQNNLGDYYFEAKGSDRDLAQVLHWYRSSAQQKNPQAQLNLSHFYFAETEHKNETQGMVWLRQSADQEYAPALNHLGVRYLHGRGVAKDIKTAIKLLEKSGPKGIPLLM